MSGPSSSSASGVATYPPTPYPSARASSLAPPARPRPLTHPPAPSRPPSTLPQTLLRLARVMSLVLGSSAIIGLITSHFLLPLLQSSYEARRVLVHRQVERFEGLIDVLRRMRAGRMYSSVLGTVNEEEGEGVQKMPSASKGKAKDKGKHKAQQTISDGALFSPVRSLDGAQNDLEKTSVNEEPDADTSLLPFNQRPPHPTSSPSPSRSILSEPFEPIPLTPLTKLSTSLRSLSAALSATSTTRTSLLSTLEGYTSQLHRDLYLRAGPGSAVGGGGGSSWGSVGSGSLGANLAKESGRGTSASGPGGLPGIGEEWDAVRKEVRAVKGLLLNRRNFAVTA